MKLAKEIKAAARVCSAVEGTTAQWDRRRPAVVVAEEKKNKRPAYRPYGVRGQTQRARAPKALGIDTECIQ